MTPPAGDESGEGGESGGSGETSDLNLISRDMSWGACEKLLDYIIKGKTIDVPGGTAVKVKTPVVINGDGISQLSQDSNIYKMMLIYRMCNTNGAVESTSWDVLKANISTKDASGNPVLNTNQIATPVLEGQTKWTLTTESTTNVIKAFFERVAPSGTTAEGVVLSALCEAEPVNANYLSDNYWVYSSSNWTVPSMSSTVTANGADFTARIGSIASPSSTDVLKYLLGAKSSQIYSFTDKLRVLEIQPANCFEYNTLDKIKELGRKLLRANYNSWTNDGGTNDYRKFISIDYVTPNALNCMTVDIASEYDLVIIGDNIGSSTDPNRLTQDSNGKTIFNDRSLNGYVYLAFGDLIKMSTYGLGYLPDEYIELITGDNASGIGKLQESTKHMWTPYLYSELGKSTGRKYFIVKDMRNYYITNRVANGLAANDSSAIDNEKFYMDHALGNVRLSDNDITTVTKEKLIEYVKTGNPIVVAESLYYADRTKIYPTSDMYDFASRILGATDTNGKRVNKNVQLKETLGTCVAYLGTKAPRIKFHEGTVSYIQRTTSGGNNVYTPTSATLPIKPVEPQYLNGIISTFNDRSLYFKFDITGQVGAKYLVKLIIDKNNDGVYNDTDLGIADDKNEVYYSAELKLSQRTVAYEINAALADNFIGMLAWKIEITQLNDVTKEPTEWRVAEKGYSAIRNTGNQELKVLQIAPQSDGNSTNYLELNDDAFTGLMDAVEDVVGYDMSVTLMSVSTFVNQYVGADNKYTKGQLGTSKDKLNGYSMVVIGFSDSYGSKDINNDNGAMDNIIDYIDAGKAVLFTHDTVSYRSSPYYKSGYRVGSNAMTITNRGGFYETLADGTQPVGDNQTHYGDTCFHLTINLRNRVGMDRYGITLLESERTDRDIPTYGIGCRIPSYMATATNSEQKTDASGKTYYVAKEEIPVRELQGFNNWNIHRMNFCLRHRSSYDIEGKGYHSIRPFADGGYYSGGNGTKSVMYTTSKVVQLNEGPVTKYPYQIAESISVTTTHGQYLELDMEDEDIVVWYALDGGDSGTSNYYKKTYKDGANNFYIYSKNNITYSGAGHQQMGSATDELKLFVNTIIKAIAGGNSAPVVTVTNGGAVTSGNYVVYVNSSDAAADYEISFKAEDRDLVSLESALGNMDLVGEFKKATIIWHKDGTNKKEIKKYEVVVGADGSTSGTALKNGIIQTIRLGDTNLTEAERNQIENAVEVTKVGANFEIVVEDSTGLKGNIFIQLQVRDLFDMD